MAGMTAVAFRMTTLESLRKTTLHYVMLGLGLRHPRFRSRIRVTAANIFTCIAAQCEGELFFDKGVRVHFKSVVTIL